MDLKAVNDAWLFMCSSTFGVIESDLLEIEGEFAALAGPGHIQAAPGYIDPGMKANWRAALGDPARPRHVTIYPGLGTAGTIAPIPTRHYAQDLLVRAFGFATFLRQTYCLSYFSSPGSAVQRLFAEIMLNDYIALWEVLFTSGVRNDYGPSGPSLSVAWTTESIGGAACLTALGNQPHPDLARWKSEVRDKISAHVDPAIDIWQIDLQHWPMQFSELSDEAARVVRQLHACAQLDIRTRVFSLPPTEAHPSVVGLSGQTGRLWSER